MEVSRKCYGKIFGVEVVRVEEKEGRKEGREEGMRERCEGVKMCVEREGGAD